MTTRRSVGRVMDDADVRLQLARFNSEDSWGLDLTDGKSGKMIARLVLSNEAIANLLSTREARARGRLFQSPYHNFRAEHRTVYGVAPADEPSAFARGEDDQRKLNQWIDRLMQTVVIPERDAPSARVELSYSPTNTKYRKGDRVPVHATFYLEG